ncbi:MAG: WYL domain-containing protein [Flavobacteriia bacterium]|nr:WYL domain-containing protein [Flavobacteriia bacterium]
MSLIKNAQIRYRVIDRCIRNPIKKYPSKEDLRKACEEAIYGTDEGIDICPSTIEKDIFAMRMDSDAPIKYSKKYKGYFYSNADFTLNDVPLTDNDIQAIKFAANTLQQFKDVELFRQFNFAIDKIVDRINISQNPREKDISTLVQFEKAVSTGGNQFLSPLLEAIRNKKIVYFKYQSFLNDVSKVRKVLPLLLKEFKNRWYVITYDVAKEMITTYALDRIEEFSVSKDNYDKNISFSPENFFKHAIGITVNNNDPEDVVFKTGNIASKYLISQPLHKSQEVIKTGKNKTTFQIKVIISEDLIREFLSYGGDIEVLEPIHLRANIIKRLQAMNEVYNQK